jgi:hypothetical protein
MDGDLAREIALGDGGRDESDVTYLSGQPGRHRVDGIRQILPGTGHTAHPRLPAQLPFRTDLARHTRHFVRERRELIHESVDRAPDLQELAAQRSSAAVGAPGAQIHPLLQVALGDRRQHSADLGDGTDQVLDQSVRCVDGRGPRPLARTGLEPLRELPLAADHPPYAGQLTGQMEILIRDLVEDRRDLRHRPVTRDREPFTEVTVPHRRQSSQ